MNIEALTNPGVLQMPSQEYHSIGDTFSSSQLKDILDDPEFFHKKYILKALGEKETIPAFEIGTYFHTAILEPEKLNDDCKVYYGVRRGAKWDAFLEENKGKAIITETEFNQATGLIDAVKNSPVAMGKIKKGVPEVSAFLKLHVAGGDVYCSDGGNKYLLAKDGWVTQGVKIPKDSVDLVVKARADLLADSFILDLKSTSGNAKSDFQMRKKVSDYNYDLSASLYLDVFSIKAGRVIKDFYWTFASKDMFNSKTYLAARDNILVGRVKWKRAVVQLAECIKNNWEFSDSLGMLYPMAFEMDNLKEEAKELL